MFENFFSLFKASNHSKEVLARFHELLAELHEDGQLLYPGGLLKRAATLYPEAVAIQSLTQAVTYKALYGYAATLSHDLVARGINSGDRVCLFFENSLEYYIAYFGIWQTGAVVVPLNTFFAEKELSHVLNDCKPALIISSVELVGKVTAIAEALAIPCMTEQDFSQQAGEVTIPRVPADRMAALLYTSGTTGFPKGVMLSSKNILTNVAQIMVSADIKNSDRLFGVLPLFHSFAQNTCIWTAFFRGLTVIIIEKIDRKNILEGLNFKPTLMIGVPAFYGLLCLMKTAPLDSVRYFVSGGDALPDKIRAGFQMIYRRKICNGYGLTETAPFIAVNMHDELGATTIIGQPGPGIACRFVDNEGKQVAPGAIGEIEFKGDNIMLGYYNAPEATAKVLHDGWFASGDLGRLNERGEIVLSGREKDLIIHKGLNIYPQEVENILMTHPLVFRAALVGKPDEQAGEIPVAFVAVREMVPGLEAELRKLCRQSLAAYKVPKDIIMLADLPVTATQKVNKPALKKQYFKD